MFNQIATADKRRLKVGEYAVQVERDGNGVTVEATAMNGEQSNVTQVKPILTALYGDNAIPTHAGEDGYAEFPGWIDAQDAYRRVVDVLQDIPDAIAAALGADRCEGAWAFPSEEK